MLKMYRFRVPPLATPVVPCPRAASQCKLMWATPAPVPSRNANTEGPGGRESGRDASSACVRGRERSFAVAKSTSSVVAVAATHGPFRLTGRVTRVGARHRNRYVRNAPRDAIEAAATRGTQALAMRTRSLVFVPRISSNSSARESAETAPSIRSAACLLRRSRDAFHTHVRTSPKRVQQVRLTSARAFKTSTHRARGQPQVFPRAPRCASRVPSRAIGGGDAALCC